ncbi:codeine O-demethylase [Cryptomeria japonica]|uniref:codeine O-demethylase n=1 Tax=Cryptomeria japonica TaxID=3369 RepID=UPI0025AC03C5|nr:codeine O-demethylase [Cryptomeria japonica]
MASSTSKMGTSFKVDDVQELAKLKREDVPERYIRPQRERIGCTALSAPPGLHVPLIDMAKIFSSHHSTRQHEMERLAQACKQWGFFQVMNHGIDLGLLELIKEVARDFFKLPVQEKEKYAMIPGTIQGYGHAFIFSDEQKLDWCDMMALGTMPKSIRKENLWPAKPSPFSDTVEAYSMEVSKLCWKLLSAIAENLGLNSNIFEEIFGENVQAVRMNFYPPCPRPDLVLGLSAHSDGSALTVLLQDDDCVGLQILKQNQWISVDPISDALVINIGDTLEVLANGEYKSVEHRAVTNGNKERLSIATFHAPSYDVELGPLHQLIDEDHPRLYKNYNHADYNRHYVTNKLNGKKSLDFARI